MRTEFLNMKTKKVVKVSRLFDIFSTQDFINLIKEHRTFTGSGLKEAKDVIENALDYNTHLSCPEKQWNEKTYRQILNLFAEGSYDPQLSREEFMNIINGAIDGMDKMHCTNMLDAVMFCLENIKKSGGLEAIAEKNDAFLEGI